ncbi:hypothetical protein [Sphingobium boeckii]|uniref:Uncharacterized protein n=1 Tax=Sphingobium boeckii TaxID=1082345 RepID=A0A7W9AHL3_9SPHN|nr:hypothetical protein [Sphingobium boeckii]MBB5685646.1 hypothetical protein [Sphingobium boeckii]
MASRITLAGQSQIVGAHLPVAVLLSAIPSLPRHILDRLVEQMICRMDDMDPNPDEEDSETASPWVDGAGRWSAPWPAPSGPWHEDDEDGHDRELVEEREIEDYEGGAADIAFDGLFRGELTA